MDSARTFVVTAGTEIVGYFSPTGSRSGGPTRPPYRTKVQCPQLSEFWRLQPGPTRYPWRYPVDGREDVGFGQLGFGDEEIPMEDPLQSSNFSRRFHAYHVLLGSGQRVDLVRLIEVLRDRKDSVELSEGEERILRRALTALAT
jgi:hypothetical protein